MKQLIVNIPEGLRYATLYIKVDGDTVVMSNKEEAEADKYVDAVLRLHRMDIINLKNQNRTANMVRARQQLCLLLKLNTKLTLNEIGAIINRHHTTVISSCTQAQNRIDTRDYPFYAEWYELLDMISDEAPKDRVKEGLM